jgi:hypothetical protein
MKPLDFMRLGLTSCGVALLIAGCVQSSLSATPAVTGHSWMLPGAASGDLLYVADTVDNRVDVFTYPAGQPAGSLTGFDGLAFMCVDKVGDIFIPNYGVSEIFKYKHGGTSPVAKLKDPRATPYSCAVDPKTGNLAVANYSLQGYKGGDVLIYRHAKGQGSKFTPYGVLHEYFCTYDDAGDLFVEGDGGAGSGGYFGLEELVPGANLFRPISLENVPAYPNGLQWDGNYLAVGTGTIAGPSSGDTYVYHMQITGPIARTIGTTRLNENGPTADFFIQGSTIVVSGGAQQPNVGLFPYPAGGASAKTISEPSPFGVVISAASAR